MLVSVILPCYNPAENWASNIVNQVKLLSEKINDPIEVIIVEDGTNPELAKDIEFIGSQIQNFKHLTYKTNRGKGFAIRHGVGAAQGDIIIYTDIDFPYTTESFLEIYDVLSQDKCEVAIGIKNDAYYKHVPLSRRILSKGLRRLIRAFLSIPVTDTQCGLKGFIKKVKPVFLKTTIDRYLFDLEFIRMAHRQKYNILPVKIELNENVQFRVMNYRILLPEVINFAKLMFRGNK